MDFEHRLVFWAGIPDGSTFAVQVSPGNYDVRGDAKLNGTFLNLGPDQLIGQHFRVPISRGTRFRMLLTITYFALEDTEAIVNAVVLRPDGSPFEQPFEGAYRGSLGGDSPEDEVMIFALGET